MFYVTHRTRRRTWTEQLRRARRRRKIISICKYAAVSIGGGIACMAGFAGAALLIIVIAA